MEYEKPNNYNKLKSSVTTKAINKEWVERFNATSFTYFIWLFFTLLLAGNFTTKTYFYFFAVGVLIVGAILSLSKLLLFYNLIKCPSCGFKLNKYKNGNNRPWTQAKDNLQLGKPCPNCGWKPNEKA